MSYYNEDELRKLRHERINAIKPLIENGKLIFPESKFDGLSIMEQLKERQEGIEQFEKQQPRQGRTIIRCYTAEHLQCAINEIISTALKLHKEGKGDTFSCKVMLPATIEKIRIAFDINGSQIVSQLLEN